jgi:hypothetical protein
VGHRDTLCPPKLSVKEQIILTLVYLRQMTTFQLLGIQFGVSESTANDTFNYWMPILNELLPSSLLEQVKKKASDYETIKEILTEEDNLWVSKIPNWLVNITSRNSSKVRRSKSTHTTRYFGLIINNKYLKALFYRIN